MENILSVTRFNFDLLKPYTKSLIFNLCIPIAFTCINRSLSSGISFAMCFIAMTSSYTFSISEKNGMDRLYGFLPVSRAHLVLGKYLHLILLGLGTLIFSLITHTVALRALGLTPSFLELSAASFLGITLFTLYIDIQLPGYFKFGYMKGKVLTFVPVFGFLGIFFLANSVKSVGDTLVILLTQPVTGLIATLLFVAITLPISILISINIVSKKEYI